MSLRVAVAQPPCSPGDPRTNAAAHADAVARAGARVVVFPELSLSGYELTGPPIDPDAPELAPIVAACATADCVALVGAPVLEEGRRSIATLVVTGAGAQVAYRKMCLGDDEAVGHTPGTDPAVVEFDGWRIGLGICKDTRIASHLEATVGAGIDLYAAGLVHGPGPDEIEDLDRRAERIAALGRVPVAFASAAGPAGTVFPATAGHSGVWSSDGSVLARCGAEPGEIVVVDLDE